MSTRALLFDVDNTLTTMDRVFRPRTIAALHRAAQAGYILGVCTGRSWAELREYILPHFPPESLHIVAGGGQVVDQAGTEYWGNPLSDQHVRELVSLITSADGTYMFASGERMYGSVIEQKRKESMKWRILFGDIDTLDSWQTHLLMSAYLKPEIEAALLSRTDISVKRMLRQGNVPYVDITAKGVTKAEGIRHWCDELKIHPKDITGFGDSENDREFLQFVGHGIALGNASPAIKSIADEVIGHTDKDGVAEYLENLVG